jgi:hypothetical protein
MDWDKVERDRRAAEHGTEPAFADVDDLTPVERRRRRQRVSPDARKIIDSARAEMDGLIRRYERMEIPERDRSYSAFRGMLDETGRVAINLLPQGTSEAALAEIREHLALTHTRLGLPPPTPRKPTTIRDRASRAAEKEAGKSAGSDRRKQPKRKIFSKKESVEVSATRKGPRVEITWSHTAAEVDEWLVIVKDGPTELTRRTLTGATRRIAINQLWKVRGSLHVRLFGSIDGKVAFTGSTPVRS